MNKENISLIINCSKEDVDNIDMSYFANKYARTYFNINPNNEKYLNILINDMETQYYSIWDYNIEYVNIDNLNIILNENFKVIEHIKNPDISIIVCLYNTEPEFFKNSINGLLNQTFKNFEVIIVNDGSDKYLQENKTFIKNLNDNRFIWINKEHSGKSQTLNEGFKHANGKYIAINDSDDISLSERLEYQYNFLEKNIEYDYISNNMIRSCDLNIFPNNFKESEKVNKDNIHYCTNHPCSMFNKKILDKIPFLFSQFYDSYEDCIFHYICFYYGINMYYDNKILMEYAYRPGSQVHYDNLKGFKHDAHYKITFTTFNVNRKKSDFGIYLILFNSKLWTNVEIEKTLLNIRISSDNVNLYILYNNEFNLETLQKISKKYGIESYNKFENNYSIFNKELYNNNDEYIGIISKPVRFYNQDWDIYLKRKLNIYYYGIVQPLLFDIQKIDDNTYINESGQNEKKYNYGERLTPLCEYLTEQNEEYYASSTNEYSKELDIPLLANDNIFFLRNKCWINIVSMLKYIKYYELSNTFISYLLFKLFNTKVKIDLDCLVGTIDYKFNIANYYNNYKLFVNKNFNETIYLHDQIFKDACKKYNITLEYFENNSSINDFLKIQNKQPWNL